MKRINLLLFGFIVFVFTKTNQMSAQTLNEFRVIAVFNGKTENGLRKFYMNVENNNTGKWKSISKAEIITGRNIQMASIIPDSNASVLKFTELIQNTEFKPLYELVLNDYLDRIDAENKDAINLPKNNTDHKIFKDSESGNLVISIKAGENDKEAIIRICAFDNSRMIVLNKPLKSFSGNMIEIGTKSLKPGNYIVIVTTAAARFSETFLIL